MYAPIYTQSEADLLLYVPKRVELEAWSARRLSNRQGSSNPMVAVEPEDQNLPARFSIELSRGDHMSDYSVTLNADYQARGWQSIARYERQVIAHRNRKPCSELFVAPFQPHRHIYSEDAFRRRREWDGCAELLDQGLTSGPQVLGQFLQDLNIRFIDASTHQALFEWMN